MKSRNRFLVLLTIVFLIGIFSGYSRNADITRASDASNDSYSSYETDYSETDDYVIADSETDDSGSADYGTDDYETDYSETDDYVIADSETDYSGSADYGTDDYETSSSGSADYGTDDYETSGSGSADYGTDDYETSDSGSIDYETDQSEGESETYTNTDYTDNDYSVSYADEVTLANYPEYSDHCYMARRNYGSSRTLTGDIKLLFVFVNDSSSSWSEDEINNFFNAVYKDCDYLEGAANEWGTYLNFEYGYFEVTVPQSEEDRAFDYLMEDFFYRTDHDLDALQNYYETQSGVNDAPLMFVYNKEGRSYCCVGGRENNWMNEYPTYFAKSMGSEMSITHELLHLYGAADYYYPVLADETAARYFPNASMRVGGTEVDDLTAYIIGWTDYLTDTAKSFLYDTRYMTKEMIDEGLRKTWEEWS